MEEKFPLYPELRPGAKEEAQALIDDFKKMMVKTCEEVLQKLYTEVAFYIESDSWNNFRNELVDGFRNYGNRRIQGEYDFAKIREKIFKDHREEIIAECNQDIVKENDSLKRTIEIMRETSRY